jgi:hypothetical protein
MSDLVAREAMERLQGVVSRHPYPLLFATISGAHLYGFPSTDSDYDERLPRPARAGGGRP